MGYMKLGVDKKTKAVTLNEGKLIPVNADRIDSDERISELLNGARTEHQYLTKVIGSNRKTGYRKYYGESNLGNFLADILKEEGEAEIGMMNPGAIRADLDVGDITVEEMVNIYPFIDGFSVVEISGVQLKELINYSLELTYGLVQFSRLTMEYDFAKPNGQRCLSVKVNGNNIKDEMRYTVACSNYVANGGDGFSMLKEGKKVSASEKNIIDYILEYIEAKKIISLPEVGRMVEKK